MAAFRNGSSFPPGTESWELGWPPFPSVSTTLLASLVVVTLFLGVGTLTMQRWMAWLGLLVASAILASHVLRYRIARRRRAEAAHTLNARLIGGCKPLGSSASYQQFYDGLSRVVLVLTDEALHLCGTADPLQIFASFPLYTIADVALGPLEETVLERDFVRTGRQPPQRDALTLSIHGSGERLSTLAFSEFERESPAVHWAALLRQSLVPREAAGAD